MGIFNDNVHNPHTTNSNITKTIRGPPGVGYKLTTDGNYDIDNKQLKNIKDGTNDTDVVSKKWIEDHLSGQAADLSSYLKKDGSVAMTDNLNMNNEKIINVAEGTESTDAVNKNQMVHYIEKSALDIQGKKVQSIMHCKHDRGLGRLQLNYYLVQIKDCPYISLLMT